MVSATNGLYWGFHNTQYRRHGLSRLYDNDFFSEDLGNFFKNFVKSRTPILESKFMSKKCGLYMRKYGICLCKKSMLVRNKQCAGIVCMMDSPNAYRGSQTDSCCYYISVRVTNACATLSPGMKAGCNI
jgi:hypothetical protein